MKSLKKSSSFFQKISVKSHEFCAYLRTVEVASLSCSSHAVSKLAAGIETPSNPNFVVQSMTPSLIIKWIRSRARLIWQKTVSRFSRAEGLDSMCLLEWIELVMDSIQKKSLLDNAPNYYLVGWCVIQKRNSSVNGLKKPEIVKGCFYFHNSNPHHYTFERPWKWWATGWTIDLIPNVLNQFEIAIVPLWDNFHLFLYRKKRERRRIVVSSGINFWAFKRRCWYCQTLSAMERFLLLDEITSRERGFKICQIFLYFGFSYSNNMARFGEFG